MAKSDSIAYPQYKSQSNAVILGPQVVDDILTAGIAFFSFAA